MGSRAWGKNDVGLIHNHFKIRQIKGQTKYKEKVQDTYRKFYLF